MDAKGFIRECYLSSVPLARAQDAIVSLKK